jgi:hypothetical protein
MSVKRNTIRYGIAAVVIAVGIVLGSMVFNSALLGNLTNTKQTGVLAVQITDPPNVPANVTDVYITYSDIQVHVDNAGNQSGWYTIAKSGEIDLMKVINVSLTLGSAPVQSGTYNLVRFDIISASVTFNGKNVSAYVPSNQITVPITKGGITVSPSGSSGLLIDVYPTVIPFQNGTSIGFVLVPAARSLPIPQQNWSSEMEKQGSEMKDIHSQSWVKDDEEQNQGSIAIKNASLTPNSLAVTVENTGNGSVTLTGLSILANSSSTFHTEENTSSHELETIASFQILSNGTVIQPSGDTEFEGENTSLGLVLQPGQSATLNFSGAIATLGEFEHEQDSNSSSNNSQASAIVSGQTYVIEVFGAFDTDAMQSVVAGT